MFAVPATAELPVVPAVLSQCLYLLYHIAYNPTWSLLCHTKVATPTLAADLITSRHLDQIGLHELPPMLVGLVNTRRSRMSG